MQLHALKNSQAFRGACLLLVGILAGIPLEFSHFFPSVALALLTFLSILLVVTPRLNHLQGLQSFLAASLWMALGVFVASRALPSDFTRDSRFLDSQVFIQGRVKEISRKANSARCVLEAEVMFHEGRKFDFPYTVLATITAFHERGGSRFAQYGNVITLGGMLSRPPEERNPGEFNVRKYYEANGIDLLMLSRKQQLFVVIDSAAGSWLMRDLVVPAREYLRDLFATLIGGEEGELLRGILIGDRSGLSLATRNAFTNAGVAHVLAVSGSNVAVVTAALFIALDLFRLSRRLRSVITSIGVVFFMLLSGSQPAVMRATVMALVFLVGGMVEKKTNAYNSLGVAAILLLLPNPRQVLDVGFQLSFVAVLSIVHLYPLADEAISTLSRPSIWRRALVWTLRVCAVSAVATLGTLPLTAAYFGRVSVISLAANIVVIPAVGASVVLGMVTAVAGLLNVWIAGLYASVNLVLLRLILWFTALAGGLPFATIDTYGFKTVDAFPFYIALLLAFHLRVRSVVRKFFLLLLVVLNTCVFWSTAAAGELQGSVRVTFMDVGQGDAVLIELPGRRSILIDTGPRSGEFDAGERIVVPFLKRRGVSTIDMLLLSHPDADHIGGAASVLRRLDVKRLVDNGVRTPAAVFRDYINAREAEGCPVLPGRAGQQLLPEDWDARLFVLSPTADLIERNASGREYSLNGTSVVVKFQYRKFSLLCVGDAGREEEAEMILKYDGFLSSAILKVGHHGSSSSSSLEFVNAVQPEHAVISVGRFNVFHHPSQRILETFGRVNAETLRTDEEGAIIFETDGQTLSRIDWR